VKIAVAVVALLAALAVAAQAPAAVIPKVVQADMASILEQSGQEDLAYIPTYAPKKYRYSTFGGSAGASHITLSPGAIGDPRALYFTIERYGRTIGECGEGRGHKRVVNGKTVYTTTGIAWRCIRAPSGHNVVVKVHGNGLTLAQLGSVAASAQRLPNLG
jgi:hypothetical protein